MADKKVKVETTHLVIGAAVLIIILVAGWMVFSRTRVDSSIVGGSENNSSETTTGTNTSSITLIVEDQTAGDSVAVKAMDLPEGGWIAIKEADSNRILGAGRFPAGATSGDVPLLRATVAGGSYVAVVYQDDGDKAFDMKVDTMVEGVSAAFKAQ